MIGKKNLLKNGTELTKFYFSLSKDQQERRMNARKKFSTKILEVK